MVRSGIKREEAPPPRFWGARQGKGKPWHSPLSYSGSPELGRGGLSLILICLLCSLGLPAKALPPSDSPGTSSFAQDATGTVWALPIPGYDNTNGMLHRWQAGAPGKPKGSWVEQVISGTTGFRARVLTRGTDGSVYAFWQTFYAGEGAPPRCLVTVQRGASSHILARFSEAVVQDQGINCVPMLAADAGGDVWLAGYRPFLWHISADGSVKTFPLSAEQHFGGKLPELSFSRPVYSLSDSRGQRWFWQSSNNWQPNSLRGVLIWDGKTLAYHPTISGVPDRMFSVIAPLDSTHVWLATFGDDYSSQPMMHGIQRVSHGTLYRVDTRTLTAVPETVPPGDLQNIVQVFQAGGDWYALDQKQNGQQASLWREEAGHWRKRLDKIEDIGGYYRPDLRHPWLAEPTGIWLGVNRGAWWLPRGVKPPIWVDWRRGLPAFSVDGLFPLTDGGILAVGEQGSPMPQAARMPAMPPPIQPLPAGLVTGGIGAPERLGPLVADPRHHLWGTAMASGSWALCEWNGKQWRTHLVPKSVEGVQSLYACDTLGRIWLTTSVWHPPAQPQPVEGRVVYDPTRNAWTNYATVADALRAAAALPEMGFLPYRNAPQPPIFSGDGRVAYVYNDRTVFLYNGHAWRQWQGRDIQPGYIFDNIGSAPRFTANGHLEISLWLSGPNQTVWEWMPEMVWQRSAEKSSTVYIDPIPPNGPRGLYGSPVVDDEEAKWFLWHDSVYTARAGLWAKQDELSSPGSPFRYGYTIEDVLRDPFGRIFFVTRPAGFYNLVVWSPPPVPKPALSVVPVTEDSVTVHIQEKLHGPHWFLWRLNGGAWSKPQKADTVMLTGLPRGDYRVEVQALDRRLLSSPAPAVAVFSIRVDPSAQVARWVRTLLTGTDDGREAAVTGLLKQPALALPALQAARSGASESGRWWLEAAIQQILDQSKREGTQTSPQP